MKLFISYRGNKFIKNLIINNNIDNIDIIFGSHKNYLYKIHQTKQIHSYIFCVEDIDLEMLTFIEEYASKIKIFIYHENINENIINRLTNCNHLVHSQLSSYSNTIIIPNLVNTQIFYNQNLKRLNDQSFICFIDDMDMIPSELTQLLYPNNTQIKLKMYGDRYKHHQCLGYTSEEDKATILNTYSNYLSINNLYAQEAFLCGCSVYSLDSILYKKNINDTISTTYELYSKFLNNILIS